jgi:hypothetical protein
MTNEHRATKAMTNKRRLTKAIFLSILSAFLFASASGQAAPKGAAKHGANADANEAVRRGVELLAKKDYVGALAAFREAREIEPTAMSAAQIAFVHIGMERWLEAYNELSDVLGESDDAWVSAHQAQLNDSLAMVRKHIGSLRVSGNPPDAQVKLRGEVVGLLPMRSAVQVVAGRGIVQVQMTGYKTSQRQVEIVPGETTDVEISLFPVAAPVAPVARALPVAPPAPQPVSPALLPAPSQASPAFAEHLREVHTYRWLGLLTGTVLLGASIPTFIWMKNQDQNRPATSKENALAIAASGGIAVGSVGMAMGIVSWIYLGLYEPDSPAHASLGSPYLPYLMIGGRF